MRGILVLTTLAVLLGALAVRLVQDIRPSAREAVPVTGLLREWQDWAATHARQALHAALPASTPAKAPEPAVDQATAPARPPFRQLSILLAGDTGFNASLQPVYAGHGIKHGERLRFDQVTETIAADISAQVNFANLETVVTDRNDLPAVAKRFNFRTHPDAVQHLMARGFNLFSTANNHALDYGTQGARETVKHMRALNAVYAGVGLNRAEAIKPGVLTVDGFRVALSSIGIGGGFGPGHDHGTGPGQLSPGSGRDFDEALAALDATTSDVKIISVHSGTEFEVTTSEGERARLRAALTKGADLAVNHHQHVVAGIEVIDGRAVFYGLGNFLHWGTQDMSRHDVCHDYGLVARVHLGGGPGERMTVRAIEAIPVTGMHKAPQRMGREASGLRLQAINYLAGQFGANGVRFGAEADGTGLYCAAGAGELSGAIGERCRAAPVVQAPSAAAAAQIRSACARRPVRVAESEDGEVVFDAALPAGGPVSALDAGLPAGMASDGGE